MPGSDWAPGSYTLTQEQYTFLTELAVIKPEPPKASKTVPAPKRARDLATIKAEATAKKRAQKYLDAEAEEGEGPCDPDRFGRGGGELFQSG